MFVELYQKKAHETAIYPKATFHLTPAQLYTALGLINEAGELAGVIKKAQRGDYGLHPTHNKDFMKKLKSEIGDVCWYLAELCTTFRLSLSEIMMENIRKLEDRKARDVLRGDGDDR